MAGISDKALKTPYPENKYRFNGGSELQNKEFSDGSGLELYDAHHRMYDPQLGRFGQIDPLASAMPYYSPYSFGSNDPISHIDPFGLKDSVYTTRTTNLAPAYVYGHKAQPINSFNFPYWDASDTRRWARNQSTYTDRLQRNQPLSQKGDPASYTSNLSMYKGWTKAGNEGRAMQSWAVGIIASPALLGASTEAIAWGLDLEISRHVGAVAVDATLQTVSNGIQGNNPISNYNFASGAAALIFGAPAEASLQNVIGVNALNATIGTSLNISAASLTGKTDVFSFHLSSILIATTFGTLGTETSGALGGGNIMDGLVAPINLTGTTIDEATKSKDH